LICTTTSGGESPGPAWASLILQPGQSLLEEALAPQAHDFSAGVQARRDLVVAPALGSEEDHLGANNLIIR
jgi:hypothetical protein